MARFVLLTLLLTAAISSARPPASPYNALKAMAAVERGEKLAEANKPDEALKEFDLAVRLDSNNAMAWAGRGIAHASLSDSDLAVSDFTRALTLTPTDSRLYTARAFIWLGKQEHR